MANDVLKQELVDLICEAEGIPLRNRGELQLRRVHKIAELILRAGWRKAESG